MNKVSAYITITRYNIPKNGPRNINHKYGGVITKIYIPMLLYDRIGKPKEVVFKINKDGIPTLSSPDIDSKKVRKVSCRSSSNSISLGWIEDSFLGHYDVEIEGDIIYLIKIEDENNTRT